MHPNNTTPSPRPLIVVPSAPGDTETRGVPTNGLDAIRTHLLRRIENLPEPPTCLNGHVYTPRSTYWTKKDQLQCRTCAGDVWKRRNLFVEPEP